MDSMFRIQHSANSSRSTLKTALPLILGCVLLLSACAKDAEPPSPPIQAPAPAPGTIVLSATVGECAERERFTDCSVSVTAVDEYGAGTTQIPAGTEIRVSFRHGLITDEEGAASISLESGTSLALTIQSVTLTETTQDNPPWQAVSAAE